MEEWSLSQCDADTSTKPENQLVLCQIRHVTKKRKRRDVPDIVAQPSLSPPLTTIGPSLLNPLDLLIEEYLNEESGDDMMGDVLFNT